VKMRARGAISELMNPGVWDPGDGSPHKTEETRKKKKRGVPTKPGNQSPHYAQKNDRALGNECPHTQSGRMKSGGEGGGRGKLRL